MAITKRQNSKNWYSEFVIGSKRYIKSTGTTNKTLASKIDLQYYNEAVEHSKLGGQNISLKDAMEKYKDSFKGVTRRKLSIGYLIDWINNNMDTSLPMTKINTRFIHDLFDKRSELGMKPSTVKHNLIMLSGVIKLMKKLGYDVCTVEMPSITVKNEKIRVLSQDEEARLLEELLPVRKQGCGPDKMRRQQELYTLAVMLLDTGCRWSEIAEIKWNQIDLNKKILNIWRPKTSTAAMLPMSDRVWELLICKEQITEWIFPNQTGDGPKGYNSQPFNKACIRAGITDFSFHSFRHSRITRCLISGMSIAQVQAVSGHSDLNSLQRYNHITSEDVLDQFRELLNNS